MGSEKFYAEERPVHEVAVYGFWMDRCAVTNEQFARFVKATGYVTLAERTPKAEDFPGALRENLVPGSMVFQKTQGVQGRLSPVRPLMERVLSRPEAVAHGADTHRQKRNLKRVVSLWTRFGRDTDTG